MAVPPDKGLLWLVSCLCLLKEISRLQLEPTTGLEPVNLFLTKEVLYQLSYVGSIRGVSGDRTGRAGKQSASREVPQC
jgi:hypothetical protein